MQSQVTVGRSDKCDRRNLRWRLRRGVQLSASEIRSKVCDQRVETVASKPRSRSADLSLVCASSRDSGDGEVSAPLMSKFPMSYAGKT